MAYFKAVKEWNLMRNNGMHCTPKKGTPEYEEVKALMPPPKPKKEKELTEQQKARKQKKQQLNKQIEEAKKKKPIIDKSNNDLIKQYDLLHDQFKKVNFKVDSDDVIKFSNLARQIGRDGFGIAKMKFMNSK